MSERAPDGVERLRAEVEALEDALDRRRGRVRRTERKPPPAKAPAWGWWERGLVALLCALAVLVGLLGGRWSTAGRAAAPSPAASAQTPLPLPSPTPTAELAPTPPSTGAPSPASIPDAPTVVALDSAAGDPVGAGRRLVFPADRAEISVTSGAGACRNLPSTPRMLVEADVREGDDHFEITFAGPIGVPLATGTFRGLELYPFCNPVKGGFSAAGGGRSCHAVVASFTVAEIAFAADGTLQRFAARFEQSCDGRAALLEGEVRLNATVPATPV